MLTLKIQGLEMNNNNIEHIKGNSVIFQNKTLATYTQSENEIIFQIHPQLEMAEYEVVREVILQITSGHNAEIDETEAQLGYLENGEKAYLIKNWEPWKEFLMKATLRTLEGQNVLLKNEDEEELGNGLLAEYNTQSNPFRITDVTIITIFGERKFTGENLTIEPTNQFG